MKRVFLTVLSVLFVLGMLCMDIAPAKAQLGGFGAIAPRRETHRETGDWRIAVDLFAPGSEKQPYWGWFGVNKVALKVPDKGTMKVYPILVTDEGRLVRYAKWSLNKSLPVEQWADVVMGPNGFEHTVSLAQLGVGARTIHYIGSIKDGLKRYTKVNILFEITIGDRKKDRKQADAFQFFVYDLPIEGKLDRELLSRIQTQQGAGGVTLVGPEIEEPNAPPVVAQPAPQQPPAVTTPQPTTVRLSLKGFSSYIKIIWLGVNAQPTIANVASDMEFIAPVGANGYELFMLDNSTDQVGIRVRNDGTTRSFVLRIGKPNLVTVTDK